MNEKDIHDMIMKHVCKEISMIAEKVQKNGTMTDTDLERLDKLYHVKKDMLTAQAMVESESYENNMSGMRGRSPSTGRYVSRDGSYEDGYSRGYSEGMNSGHMPMNPYYPEPRRW